MKDKKDKKKPLSLEQELQAMEHRLVRLISDRARLLKKSALARKSKSLSLVDPGLEKSLWQEAWRQKIDEAGLDQRRCRSVFQTLNSLGSDLAESPEDRPFSLAQRNVKVNIDIDGPRDILMARMWLALATGAGAKLQLDPVVMNDPLYELAKALNQAGGQVAWEHDRIGNQGGDPLDFDRKVIFAGQDSLNTHLLIVLAALHPGVGKVTGGSSLKLVNLKAVQDLLPQLGARASPLVPGSQGLPLRIEASGSINDTIRIPANANWELGAAVLLLAPLMGVRAGRMTIHCTGSQDWEWKLTRVLHILEACGVEVSRDRDVFQIGTGPRSWPEQPTIPCDPALNSYVHGFAAIAGGKVATRGNWPDWMGETSYLQSVAPQLGLAMTRTESGLMSEKQEVSAEGLHQDLTALPEFAPLALTLGVVSETALGLKLDPDQDLPFAVDLLDSLHKAYEIEDGRLILQGGLGGTGDPAQLSFQAPSAWWGLGLALLSMARPNMVLRNPGELTSLWPRFWTLYRGLPEPGMEKREENPKESATDHGARKKRRIVD